ncbi:hypothetical protein [Microbaculum marinum]|uniref:Uncharacterized protein n=1 Tax=Microbaculum marinum TaxID=1764581 RepID=A0AAW9RRA0_9HYPH
MHVRLETTMGIFDWLFGRRRADDIPEDDRKISDPELSPGKPMAGVGAEVAADDRDSESKKALDDAVLRDQARW